MTTSRISGIIPLFFITLLCVGMVEGGYQMFEHFVLDLPPEGRVQVTESPAEQSGAKGEARKKPGHQVILQRNLFGALAGDKPVAPPPVPENTALLAASSLQVVLMGTVTGSEGAERAIILDKAKKKQELYSKGDQIQGALIKEIRRGKVILAQNGREEILDISEAAKVRPRVPLPAQPPPAPVNHPAPPEPVPQQLPRGTAVDTPGEGNPSVEAPSPVEGSPPEEGSFLGEGSAPRDGSHQNATQIRLSRGSHTARGGQPGMSNQRSNATQHQGTTNE